MFCDVVKLSSIQQEREESTKKNLLLLNDVAVSEVIAKVLYLRNSQTL